MKMWMLSSKWNLWRCHKIPRSLDAGRNTPIFHKKGYQTPCLEVLLKCPGFFSSPPLLLSHNLLSHYLHNTGISLCIATHAHVHISLLHIFCYDCILCMCLNSACLSGCKTRSWSWEGELTDSMPTSMVLANQGESTECSVCCE